MKTSTTILWTAVTACAVLFAGAAPCAAKTRAGHRDAEHGPRVERGATHPVGHPGGQRLRDPYPPPLRWWMSPPPPPYRYWQPPWHRPPHPRGCGPRPGHPPRRWRPGASPLPQRSSWNRALLGSLIGGALGGYAGAQIGAGHGRTAAIVGGSLLGVWVGGEVGRAMDRADRLALRDALEEAPPHGTVGWDNPDTRARYAVTPADTYQSASGRYCREFQTTATIGGRTRNLYGNACREPDGSWEIVD